MNQNLIFLLVSTRVVDGFQNNRTSTRGVLESCTTLVKYLQEKEMPDVAMKAEDDCSGLAAPSSHANSGGWCYATLSSGGHFRAAVINPITRLLMRIDNDIGQAPIITLSNSGGSMFSIRYFTLRDVNITAKWTFPCYLLKGAAAEVCFFHGWFGSINDECQTERFNVVTSAAYMVFAPLLMIYGGPLGVASAYISAYFPFIAGLPLLPEQTFLSFWSEKSHYNTEFAVSSNWAMACTLVDPTWEKTFFTSGAPANYGFNAYLSRGMVAFAPLGDADWWFNWSTSQVGSVSTNTLTLFNAMPFSAAGKSWDAMVDSDFPFSIALKLFGITISFIMVVKMIFAHAVWSVSASGYDCGPGCLVGDGAGSDNTPITPGMSYASKIASTLKPSSFQITGAASTFNTVRFLLGEGPLSIGTMGSINVCPFSQPSICEMIGQVRTMAVWTLDQQAQVEYWSVANAYQIFKPWAQIIAPFCGDPLIFDEWIGMCQADGHCTMLVNVIASKFNDVVFSPTPYISYLSMCYVAKTPMSGRWVNLEVPAKLFRTEYYSSIADWFPNFNAISPGKGGVGFTTIAGNLLLDYMTFMMQRLTHFIVMVLQKSHDLSTGKIPKCGLEAWKSLEDSNVAPGEPLLQLR